MKNFEERLTKLEELGERIRQPDLSLDDALKTFEEGIKLARGLEKDLDRIEGKVQILMNGTDTGGDEKPELELFGDDFQ